MQDGDSDSEAEDTVVDLPTEEERRRRMENFLNDELLANGDDAKKLETENDSTIVRETLGFVSDWHRINVALTRAKDMCLVYGNGELLEYITSELKQKTNHLDGNVRQTAVTTIDSSKEEILAALQAADEDPFLLGTLIQHAKYAMRHHYGRQARHKNPMVANMSKLRVQPDYFQNMKKEQGGSLLEGKAIYVEYDVKERITDYIRALTDE
ncbi:AAA domain containing protein, putative [Angomonas deanei]|uniref:AAA domain containing protein, putative n=1 Tax=Angomonas deanei TaxID=59799 RepID=A0A7G2CKR1_9TRYP|nr:AAA domain containing protein, putative [Angomonas deanei]